MSARLPLRWRLTIASFALTGALLLAVGLYLLNWTEHHYTDMVADDLRRECTAIGGLVSLPKVSQPETVSRLGRDLGHRITLIDRNGTVRADSSEPAAAMPDHSNRPEFRQALATGYGRSTRYSETIRTLMLYVAVPYGPEGRPTGVVRVAEPLAGLDTVLATIKRTFMLAALIALVAAAALSYRISAGITRPIEDIAAASVRLQRGEPEARVSTPHSGPPEVRQLAQSFNETAVQISASLEQATRQTARLQTVFEYSEDPVILLDRELRVAMMNPAALKLFALEHAPAGKTLLETALSHDLNGLAERARDTGHPASLDIQLARPQRHLVYAYVAPAGTSDVLVVLHDLTVRRRIDAAQKDFLANASHELRTPLATIRSMAETILLRKGSAPEALQSFAEGIVREAGRMTQLVDDLLSLASLEAGSMQASPEPVSVREVVDDVLERLGAAAQAKMQSVLVSVGAGAVVCADRRLLTQALLNLADNAIKYTPAGGEVKVCAELVDDAVRITVSDNGPGIPHEDQSRIFERFYRVDPHRSREMGGTGLGLAIVRNACDQMGGTVSVASREGDGSVFTINLPCSPNNAQTPTVRN